MDKSLKELESQLESLTPKGLSDEGRNDCRLLIDRLASEEVSSISSSPVGLSWLGTAAAAAVALGVGVGGGWYLGADDSVPLAAYSSGSEPSALVAEFEQLDRESWHMAETSPDVYVAKDGEIRELSHEVEMTTEVVKHRQSGVIVTVETTDHHLVDSVKSEF
mgnify:CR=1 FL=1